MLGLRTILTISNNNDFTPLLPEDYAVSSSSRSLL